MEDILTLTWSRASSCPSGTQLRLRPAAPGASLLVLGLVVGTGAALRGPQSSWSHLQSCQAGPQQCPELSSSSWEQNLFSSQQDLAAGPAQRSPACPQAGCQHRAGGRAAVPAGMLCVPGCAWRSWRWEQGRKDAHPVGYKAIPSSAMPALRCVDGQPVTASEFSTALP